MIETLAASAALLLVVSGAGKLHRPAPAAVMLGALTGRYRVPVSAARSAGAVEAAVGALALALGGRVAFALLASAYAVLAVVAALLLAGGRRSGRRVACGCFGSTDAPIGPGHLVLDVAGLLVAGSAAAVGTGAFAGLNHLPAPHAVVAALQIVLLSWSAYLAVTELPVLSARRRELTGANRTEPSNAHLENGAP